MKTSMTDVYPKRVSLSVHSVQDSGAIHISRILKPSVPFNLRHIYRI